MALSLHEFATSELHLFEIPDRCTFATLEASQVQDSRPSHIRDFEASQVQDSRPSHIHDFLRLRMSKIPDLHTFATLMLRRFKIPDLREFCVLENSLHEFHISRRFEGDKFS
jgi:hypothetical protein